MTQLREKLIGLAFVGLLAPVQVFALIGPVRMLSSGSVLLVPNNEVKLSEQHIELYHHPLGIWLVDYRARFQNLTGKELALTVGFPAGFDVRLIENNLHCDRFDNFKAWIDHIPITDIHFMVQCANYVPSTECQWRNADGSEIGFLNTWELNFKPYAEHWVTVSFSFIIKKLPPIYNPDIDETWYRDLMNWLKADYAQREENNFQLPLNIGSFWAFYPDSMIIRIYPANNWLKIVGQADRKFAPRFIKKVEYSEPIGCYSPPEVPLDTLSIEQLEAMTPTELTLLRNAFFAKYGKSFQNEIIKKYFLAQPWYAENPNYHDWYLTPWDLNNIKRIIEVEKRSQAKAPPKR
ncbi:MAG: YARHG domain-containing protein [candidate division KSB1 bacterium]|nr:YARHG domain-containing protein [candidate division KSB1 bacterium]MDZ7334732.1 YARHG domain-containing protein [candidate division KSB1 bacterium]MDZ7358250.1 YARHG domain-containing protein [candidate division KSB1 bacterium]